MLNHFLESIFTGRARDARVLGSNPVIRIEPRRSSGIVIGPSTPIIVRPSVPVLVQPPPRGVWQEKGWIFERHLGSETYRGQYSVFNRALRQPERFGGQLQLMHREIHAFIADPPPAICSHPKGPCFSLINAGWYQVHWHRPPKNVDDAILYIERILDEVTNRRFR